MKLPSLNRHLVFAILVYGIAFAIPLAATAALGAWLYQKQRTISEQSFQALLQSLFEEKVDNDFRNLKSGLKLLSSNSDLTELNWEHAAPWVRKMASAPDFPFEKIVIAQPNGTYWTEKPGNPFQGDLQTKDNKDPHSEKLNLSVRPYWPVYISGPKKDCFITGPVISMSTKVKQWVVACPIQAKDSNGMLAGTVDWNLFHQKIHEIITQLELNHSLKAKIAVIDAQKRYVFSEDTNLVLRLDAQGHTIPSQEFHAPPPTKSQWHALWDPSDSIHFQVQLPSIQSTAIVSVSRAELLGAMRQQFIFALLSIVLAIVSGMLFHALHLLRSRKNLNKLYHASYQLMQGQSPDLYPQTFPRGEWQTVAHAFKNTANQLLEREQELLQHKNDLEIEVQKRTAIALESRAESNRLQVILEQIPVSVIITDLKEKIVFANDFFCQSTGYSHDFILGKNPRILKSGMHTKDFYLEMWKKLSQGQTWRGTLRNRKKNGEFHWVQTTILPYFNTEHQLTHYVAVHEDISELKQQEDALRRTTKEAQIAAETKAEFLSVMSHEIRTPLNAVVGFAQILQMESHLPEQEDSLQSLERSARHLLGLVNDILDFSKIEAGRLELHKESTSITRLCQDSIQMFQSQAIDKGIELSLELDPKLPAWVEVDALRLGQVLINLLSNAVKFTTKGGVYLKLQCLQDQEHSCSLHFTIQDTGIGISPEQVERLFQPFTQAHSGISRQFGGSGLGLVISQKIIELHQSQLQLYSEPGHGSTFFFRLDLPKCEAPSKIRTQSLHKWPWAKILIVDDNHLNLKVGKKFLEMWELQVSTASSGALALELLEQESFHLILMDLQMPGMNGYQCSESILKQKPEQIILALSAEVGDSLDVQLHKHGMQELIPKPFNPEHLHQTLAKYLQDFETPS